MSTVIISGILILAGTLLYAGATKLIAPANFREALHNLGLAPPLAAALSVIVPVIEIILGVLTIVFGNVPLLMWCTAALLLSFTAVLAVARGRSVPCACFGNSEDPPGASAFLRNALLLIITTLLSFAELTTFTEWLSETSSAELGLIVLGIISLFLSLFALKSAHGTLLLQERLGDDLIRLRSGDPERPSWHGQGLPIGTPIPSVELVSTVTGIRTPLSDSRDEGDHRSKLFVFAGSDCPACRQLAENLTAWKTLASVSIAIVEVFRNGHRLGLPGADYEIDDTDGRLARFIQAKQTPAAVLVDRDGRIVSACARGQAAVEELINIVSEHIGAV